MSKQKQHFPKARRKAIDPERQLQAWIARSPYTQKTFAKRIGVCPATIHGILSGTWRPNLRTALFIEATTGIPPRAWLLELDRAELARQGLFAEPLGSAGSAWRWIGERG